MYYLKIQYAKLPEGWGSRNSSYATEEEAKKALEEFYEQAKKGLLDAPVRRINWNIEYIKEVADGSYELSAA